MISHIGKWLLISSILAVLLLGGCAAENREWIIEVEGGDSCASYTLWGWANVNGQSRFEDEILVSFPFSAKFISPENVVVTVISVGLCGDVGLDLLREFDNSIPEEIREKIEFIDYENMSDDRILVKVFQDGVLVQSGKADPLFDFIRVF